MMNGRAPVDGDLFELRTSQETLAATGHVDS